jgi:hypothetical protein
VPEGQRPHREGKGTPSQTDNVGSYQQTFSQDSMNGAMNANCGWWGWHRMRLLGNEAPFELALRDTRCVVCGGEPSALWRGKEAIFVCPQCVRDVLPRLKADALTSVARKPRRGDKHDL